MRRQTLMKLKVVGAPWASEALAALRPSVKRTALFPEFRTSEIALETRATEGRKKCPQSPLPFYHRTRERALLPPRFFLNPSALTRLDGANGPTTRGREWWPQSS